MTSLQRTSRFAAGIGLLGSLALAGNASAVNLLSNPGFEAPDASGGDVYASDSWFGFNDVFTTTAAANTGSQALKIFGPFFPGGGAGAVQPIGAVAPGEIVNANAFAFTPAGDALTPSNFAVVKIEFLDAGSNIVGFNESVQINTGNLPVDTWTQFSASGVAPANTATAQVVLVHVQLDPVTGGSIFFDDAYAEVVPEPTSLALIALGSVAMLRRRRS